MQKLSRKNTEQSMPTERVIQFGEGNFLRGFIDVMFHEMNEKSNLDAGVVVVQPIPFGKVKELNSQDGLYHVILNEKVDGEVKTSITRVNSITRGIDLYADYENFVSLADNPTIRFIFSNTTEAGITYVKADIDETPPQSFPAKVALLLKRRFEIFKGDAAKGIHMIPCELIERNGDKLKEIILQHCTDWNLNDSFVKWINESCFFHNTLVDRIVSGFPTQKAEKIQQQVGFSDQLLVEAEGYGLLVIQGDKKLKDELPVQNSKIEVVFTDDITPYRQRKVKILNGAHTSLVPVAYFLGVKYVHELFENADLYGFIRGAIYEEIIPTIAMPKDEIVTYADDVLNRFRNESLNHAIASIALNSISKFKVRVLPSLLDFYNKDQNLPKHLVYSFAALLYYYKGEFNGNAIQLSDDQMILDRAKEIWGKNSSMDEAISKWLSSEDIWGMDLNSIQGLCDALTMYASQLDKGVVDIKNL